MLYGRTSSNRLSRFLEEIPEENRNWEGKDAQPGGTAFGTASFGGAPAGGGSYGGGGGGTGVQRTASLYSRPARPPKPSYQEARRITTQPAGISIDLAKGDLVEHSAFGRGTVASVQPMGGDALVQVDFEGKGSKKLMLKAAAKHLKKLEE